MSVCLGLEICDVQRLERDRSITSPARAALLLVRVGVLGRDPCSGGPREEPVSLLRVVGVGQLCCE